MFSEKTNSMEQIILEKLRIAQPFKKSSAFAISRHWILFYADEFTAHSPIKN
jgi:hypothetical protein